MPFPSPRPSGSQLKTPPGRRAGSIDPQEVAKFSAMAEDWWSPTGMFKPLHALNPVRLAFIRDQMCTTFGRDRRALRPFEGLDVVDVGCGGGLLCEPLARLGAQVTGIDATADSIRIAETHAAEQGLPIAYHTASAEDLVAAGARFDVVLNMEVVEHVPDPAAFLSSCARLLRPGGVMIVSTLNKTAKAYALAIVAAERLLGWVPKGTHDFARFIAPAPLARMLETCGLICSAPIGVTYRPLQDRWEITADLSVNYMMAAHRPETAGAEGGAG